MHPEALVLAAKEACSGLHTLGGMNLWIQLAQERSTAPSYELVQAWKAASKAACRVSTGVTRVLSVAIVRDQDRISRQQLASFAKPARGRYIRYT